MQAGGTALFWEVMQPEGFPSDQLDLRGWGWGQLEAGEPNEQDNLALDGPNP